MNSCTSSQNHHSWDVSPTEAIQIQQDLRSCVKIQTLTHPITAIAGADISFNKYSDEIYAGMVVLSFPKLELLEQVAVVTSVKFPYIPGLLSFREIPSLWQVWHKLKLKPDVVMFDGQGIAHPRRLGIASHFGVLSGCPTIGCAKSLLTGKYIEPGLGQGDYTPLMAPMRYGQQMEKIGMVLRTKKNVKPVFVSPGHLVSFDDAREVVLQCVTKYRLPEPTRQAHILVNKIRKGEIEA
jgi:deoxyribonuclease V